MSTANTRDRGWTWRPFALCAQTDPEFFFPEKGKASRDAKKTCMRCEVRADCLEEALANGERFGIWGGTTEGERKRIKRQRRLANGAGKAA